MEGGPPGFPRDSSCPAVLRCPTNGAGRVPPTGLSPAPVGHPRPFGYAPVSYTAEDSAEASIGSYNPRPATPAGLAPVGFGLLRVRSPLLAESRLISTPRGTKMFQFPRFPSRAYGFSTRCEGMTPRTLPHSGIPGSTPADGSPRLFAANHALHRLLAPRHPPCALRSAAPAPSRARHTPDLAQYVLPDSLHTLCTCSGTGPQPGSHASRLLGPRGTAIPPDRTAPPSDQAPVPPPREAAQGVGAR